MSLSFSLVASMGAGKKACGATSDGLPLHSFSTLLAHPATRCGEGWQQ